MPVLTNVSSEGAAHDDGSITLVVKGRNCYDISVVYLNGRPLETSFANIRELRAILPADERPATGPNNVTVRTGWPGGGTSEPEALSVQ